MSGKKKLLFVMNSLVCGGAEKSLISLLQSIDYSRCDVDLLLFKHEGLFMNKIPDQVRLLDAPPRYKYFDMSIKKALKNCLAEGKPGLAYARIRAGFLFKKESHPARREQLLWKYSSKSLPQLSAEYDAAIGYMENSPIRYVVDKVVKARKKIGFIHNDYDKLGMNPDLDDKYFSQLDCIATVSEECVQILKDRFPAYKEKIALMHNIVSPSAITKMSSDESPIQKQEQTTIVSVGRLNYQKGFNMAVEACDLLVREGYDIRWYIIGEGEERGSLERLIQEKGLQDILILTGLRENPYPYIKQCDIYVQTSLFEGRCLTITEAKILHKPIVSTDFEVIFDQLTDGYNGLIVGRDAHSIYSGVKKLIDDQELRERFIGNLGHEEMGTEDEVHKLYQWIS
ncbi:Glycosyltransferase involved in cell wall bisynthesis [Paenibacillus sophorae]|uniref:Glycosyltransferase involved in cell wall bisynthesis n=2 Tax=Paenibacillus sophorae TaxID=1333845 RepID=A0A1H8RN83_9BACL|nr:glycosyltransferase [Paenibacillus sophorae]SEO67840.1 Glycosyltransferase involved in cell wall bisynthesis [Paenibacillus sophorae]